MIDWLKNTFLNRDRYKTSSKAVIVSCFFNPQNNPYRILAFQKWYHSIKHLPHRIIECLIGPDAKQQLPSSPYISQVHADTLLFHKEALLNKVIASLPDQFEYVFWLDTDVLFTNDKWLVEGVEALQQFNIIQPFEFCVHLDRNQLFPSFPLIEAKRNVGILELRNKKVWRSFAATYQQDQRMSGDSNYDLHGHVGFAWGARRSVLQAVPLYEEALVGGADHILAHAAAGQIPHPCIQKGFADNLDPILAWSRRFFYAVQGSIGFVPGDLLHLWHGEVTNRKYLKRVQEFTSAVPGMEKDKQGFYKATGSKAAYVKRYYKQREVGDVDYGDGFDCFYIEPEFIEDMGYALADIIGAFTQPSYTQDDDFVPAAQEITATDPDVPAYWPAQEAVPDSTPDVPDSTPPVDSASDGVPDSTPAPSDIPDSTLSASTSPGEWPTQGEVPDSTPAIPDSTPNVDSSTWEPAAVPDSTPDSNFS